VRGFTTVRDVGGPVFGLKRAIDLGVVDGPRIYPSGAMITVTSGHGDFHQMFELPRTIGGPLSRIEQIGGAAIADSPDEVRVRKQLMQGASQIKLTAGGGKIKTAWGTDILFAPALAQRQGAILASLARWYTPAEALVMATTATPSCLRCPASAIRIPASSTSSQKVRTPTSCSSTAIRSRI